MKQETIVHIGITIIISLIAFIIAFYPSESKVKDLAAQAATNALCPVKDDITDIKSEMKDIKSDIKEISRRMR